MTSTATATVNHVTDSDLQQHIEDTSQLFWIFRNGRQIQRSWNELTTTEKAQQREAQRRATYVSSFDIYSY